MADNIFKDLKTKVIHRVDVNFDIVKKFYNL
jgi:hypothetical protein